jgi:hypothetical protein
MPIMAWASRAVQEPAALAIPLTGPGSGWAFTDRTYAKQRHVCATRRDSSWGHLHYCYQNAHETRLREASFHGIRYAAEEENAS